MSCVPSEWSAGCYRRNLTRLRRRCQLGNGARGSPTAGGRPPECLRSHWNVTIFAYLWGVARFIAAQPCQITNAIAQAYRAGTPAASVPLTCIRFLPRAETSLAGVEARRVGSRPALQLYSAL